MKHLPPYKLMRIATVPSTFALQLKGQVPFMLEHGWTVQVVSSPANQWYAWPEDIPAHCITEVPIRRRIHLWADAKALWQLCSIIKKHRPHIVHTHSPKAGLLGMLAARLCRVPVRLHTLAGTPYTTATGLAKKILWCTEKLTCACTTQTWVISNGLLQEGLSAGFLLPSKSRIIAQGSSNGVALTTFTQATAQVAQAELSLALPGWNGENVWLYIGRLVHEKGLDELLPAFTDFAASHPGHVLVCIGPLEQQRDPLAAVTLALLQKHPAVVHIPWSPHIASWLKLAFCLVHPSHREGLPNVLLEAGAAGCPVLVSRIAGNSDVVSSDAMGYFFPAKNKAALLQQIETVAISTEAERRQKALSLQLRVQQLFNRPKVQAAIEQAYASILGKPNSQVDA